MRTKNGGMCWQGDAPTFPESRKICRSGSFSDELLMTILNPILFLVSTWLFALTGWTHPESVVSTTWKAGRTYRFLLRGRPTENGYTIYTAYFSDAEDKNWQLIASFKRPKTTTYLKSPHSFLENFMPNTGNLTRQVAFGNQWVRSKEGVCHELVRAKFTGDATARAGLRPKKHHRLIFPDYLNL